MREHDYFDDDDVDRIAPRRRDRRRARFDDEPEPDRRGRMTLEARERIGRLREDAYADPEIPDGADRWSTWADSERGPHPLPDWVITQQSAVDTELGVLKTGKEAEVHLLRRGIPGGPSCLLAAKRYRSGDHRLFHRDAGYLEGRRMRRSREMRAMRNRTAFGRNLIAEQWAVAEFAALTRLWSMGTPVPYPVQRDGTELLIEFLGDADGVAAPRLNELRPERAELRELWRQLTAALELLAGAGLTHGDLSAYNLLVHSGQLMLIDLPQLVDVVSNPRGQEFLERDVHNVCGWFRARGLTGEATDPRALLGELNRAAGLT
ncbi:MAG: phosphotransferase [Pseudonocardiaceae bacterium]|nr:phosphotransferase [Pseudonocardiaceae bacterium]